MNKLVRQSFRILAGRAAVSVVSLVITIFFAYELPKNVFALTVLYSTAASLLMVFTDLGLHVMVIKEAAQPFKDPLSRSLVIQNLIMPCTVLRIVASVFSCMILGLVLLVFESRLSAEYPVLNTGYVIGISCVGILFENFNNVTLSIFSIKSRFGADSFLSSMAELLENVFGVLGYLWGGINQYFLGLAVAQIVIFVVRCMMIADVLGQFRPKQFSLQKSFQHLKSYFPYYVRKFFRFGIVQGEQLLVVFLLPLEQLANFNLAKRVTKFLKVYIEAFGNPLTIRLSKTRNLAVLKEYKKTFLLFTIPVCLVAVLISPYLMQWVGGDKYADNWPIMAVFCFSWAFYAYSTMQLSVVIIFGDNKDILYVDVVGGLIGLVSTYLLILTLGETGLAWGQVVSFLTLAVLGHFFTKRYEKTPLPESYRPPMETSA